MTVRCDQKPTLAEAARLLRVVEAALDAGFGVVEIDPDLGLYSVRVAADAVQDRQDEGGFRGPFSDPKIAPMR